MTTIAPETAGSAERRLDDGARALLDDVPAALAGVAWKVDELPVEWLPVLAWALSVEVWSPDWSVSDRRRAIRESVRLHREKGTAAAVKRVLDAIGAVYNYTEPSPFNCRIEILNSASLHGETLAALKAAVGRVKRASVVCTIVSLAGLPLGHVQLAAGFTTRTVVRKAFVLRLEEAATSS